MTAPLPTGFLAALLLVASACAQAPEATDPAPVAPVPTQQASGVSVSPEALFERAAAHLAAREAEIIAVRHDLHRHPELSGAETRTSGVVADHLERLGWEVQTGVGGTGVVGLLRGARPGPTVAFRADMDAVRSAAPDPAEAIRSLTPGVRHICGHDVHTAIGLALAEAFSAVQSDLAGGVMLVFQPAEETASGARAMIADGVFETDVPDAFFAVHTAPWNVGQIAVASGGMMAGRARVAVTIRGEGDLAPEAGAVREALLSVGTVPPEQIMQPAPPGFALVQLFGGGGASGG